MELADIHNRRANIELVSKRAKEHGYPLLVWPEDKELLRVDDLPVTEQPNRPVDWTALQYMNYRIIRSNKELRKFIVPGRAYAIGGERIGKASQRVDEYAVVTR